MTVVALCLEAGAFGEPFIHDLAAALELQVHVLQCSNCWCEVQTHSMPSRLYSDRLFARVTAEALEVAARGNVLIVGWSAAVLLLPLGHAIRVWVRAPLPQRAWNAIRRFRSWQWRVPQSLRRRDFDLVLDAGRQTARDGQREIAALLASRRMKHVPSASPQNALHGWRPGRGSKVLIEGDEMSLTGTASQEAAIARIEQHLHGAHALLPPCNPLCHRSYD